MHNRRNHLEEARRQRQNPELYAKQQEHDRKITELNKALRSAIHGRPHWIWQRAHGGYAMYNYGIRQIGIINVNRDEPEYYDAEEVKNPFNAMIMYDATDVNEVIKAVEDYFQ